jgi:Fe-S cluster assembly protein SufD
MINRVFVMSGDEQRRMTITPKQGTHTKVIAVVVGQKRSRPSLDLKISHQDPDAESDIVIRTLALDRSRIKVHGLLDIRKGAKRTKTYLKADALMLGDTANVDLVPSLEIDENDVRAGHGASVGRVDDEQLFYLTSRGIDRKSAERMVAEGFLRSVFPLLTSRDQKKIRKVLNNAFAVA